MLFARSIIVLLGLLAFAVPAVADEAEPNEGPVESAADLAPEPGADASPQDPNEERLALIEQIRQMNDLPPQQDTGTLESTWTWMPQSASAQAEEVDFAFAYILWVSIIFTIIVVGLMTWFLIKYRAKSDDEPDPVGVTTHSTTLEITWTLIPTCIVLVMFVLGFKGYLNDQVAPPNAYTVDVTAYSWGWSFKHPNGAITNDLHLPVNRPVQFRLISSDVIHSLYIPAFRMKKDVVPGRRNTIWTTPTQVGIYELACTEYCGTLHSRMGRKVFVYEAEQFEDMLAKVSNLYVNFATKEPYPIEEVGSRLASARGCIGCHSIDGSAGTGPTWRDLWGDPEHAMADGSIVAVDAEYIRNSIYYPGQQIVAGYGNAMASYLGILSERDVEAIIAYMKTISVHSGGNEADPAPDGGVVTDDESTAVGGDL
jgi:cytochrome c oxidase subunit 2